MSSSLITLRVEDQLKEEASRVAQDLGIPLATYLKMCLKKLIQEQAIYFERSEIPNLKTAALLRGQIEDFKNNKNMVGPFETIDDLEKSLLS